MQYTRLDEVMSENRISTSELAKKLGKTQQYVTNLRKGYSTMSLKVLYQIAEAIGCSPAELLK